MTAQKKLCVFACMPCVVESHLSSAGLGTAATATGTAATATGLVEATTTAGAASASGLIATTAAATGATGVVVGAAIGISLWTALLDIDGLAADGVGVGIDASVVAGNSLELDERAVLGTVDVEVHQLAKRLKVSLQLALLDLLGDGLDIRHGVFLLRSGSLRLAVLALGLGSLPLVTGILILS